MTRYFCHCCSTRSTTTSSDWSGRCAQCGSSFTEVLDSSNSDQARGRSTRDQGGNGGRGNNPSERGRHGAHAPSIEEEDDDETEDSPRMMSLFSSLLHNYISGHGGMVSSDMMGNMGEAWMEQIAAQLMEEYQPTSFPTASKIVSALPTYNVRHRSAKGEPGLNEAFACAGEPCSVCHDEFVEKTKVVELCCSHCFHKDCIKPWLKTHNTCPVCRIELETEEDS